MYKITPEKVEGYKSGGLEKDSFLEVELKANSHREANFTFSINNRISGRLFDAKGKPLKDVCLRLRPVQGKVARGLFQMDCTNENGSFEFDEIPTGTYILVVNEEGKVTSDQPFETFYYPSTKRREDAAQFVVGPGEFRDDLILNPAETAKTVTLTGSLKFDNGKVADKTNSEYVYIEFFADGDGVKPKFGNEPDSRGDLDENGKFSIRILKGQKGRLIASMMVYEGKYEKCTKLDKFIRGSKDKMPAIKSNEIRIEAVSDLSEIDLRFPFPSCKLADDDN